MRGEVFLLVCRWSIFLLPSSAAEKNMAEMNMEFASQLVLGQDDGNWQQATQSSALHRAGLLGSGQIVGLGDTGVDASACSFQDDTALVPFGRVSWEHRKIAGYFPAGGDQSDSSIGHGTHIAGTMVGQLLPSEAQALGTSENLGMAPAARLVVVDVEKSSEPGVYKVPESSIDAFYFDYFRNAQANIVCSPWSYEDNLPLQNRVDSYVWNHPTFLPVFPSGNVRADASNKNAESPCTSKNALCVGASYNAPRLYQEQPSFVHSALLLGLDNCVGDARGSCAAEVDALPALFGATKPKIQTLTLCENVVDDCLDFRAACPECAYDPSKLLAAVDAPVTEASPAEACAPLNNFPRGQVCLVRRGTCSFLLKAKHCSEAGAVGVIVVNSAGEKMVVMTGDHTEIQQYGLILPVMMVSHSDGTRLLQSGARLTFPVISSSVTPQAKAPYSRYGGTAAGRMKPEVVLPGDGISSAAVGLECGFQQMSGTSQSCGLAAGAAALVREYFSDWADQAQARLAEVQAASIKAALVAAAQLDRRAVSSASTVMLPEVGFGMPSLAAFLPIPAGPGLVAIQSEADSATVQRFCLARTQPTDGVSMAVALAWTDPPSNDGALVHDLDLEVLCDVSNWALSRGNGGSTADRVNNVEKVLLLGYETFPSALCIARVVAPGVSSRSPQPFSLMASGFALAPCATEVRAPECGDHGMAVRWNQNKWTCQCSAPYLGPFCDQQATPVPLTVPGTAPSEVPGSVPGLAAEVMLGRSWQWSFFTVEITCGAGDYELQIEQPPNVEGAVLSRWSWGHLHTTLADSATTAGVAVSNSQRDLQSGGRVISLVVRIDEPVLSDLRTIFIGLQWQGRSGKNAAQLRWLSGEGTSCGIGTAPGTGSNSEQLVLGICLAVVGVALAVAAVLIFKYFRGRQKVLPHASSQRDVEQAEGFHTSKQQWQFES